MPPRLFRAVLAATLAALALPTAAPAQSGPYSEVAGPISAYPSPGTVSAGPRTQISLRGARASRLGTIRVSGPRSGRHTGRLQAHSDGQGASSSCRAASAAASESPCGPICPSAGRATAISPSGSRAFLRG